MWGSCVWSTPPLSSPPSNVHFDLFLNSSVPSCFDFNKYFDGVRAGFGTLHWCEARVGGITHSLFLCDHLRGKKLTRLLVGSHAYFLSAEKGVLESACCAPSGHF